uniref:Uncharacterized protein n=1 Tax=Globodera rostochiensis TaxID=31243 RepID=A0A914HIX2_GLORO
MPNPNEPGLFWMVSRCRARGIPPDPVPSMAQPSVPASSLAMLQQQQQSQMLVQQQEHQQQLQHYGGIVGAGTSSMGAAAVMPPASPMVVSPSSAGLADALKNGERMDD